LQHFRFSPFFCLFFFCLVAIAGGTAGDGRVSVVSRGYGATERRRRVTVGGQLWPPWACLFPRACPLCTELILTVFLFPFVEFNTYAIGPKKIAGVLEMCLKTSRQEMKLSAGLMFFE